MERLWSPWRSQYISSFNTAPKGESERCFLCEALASPETQDVENLVVHRAATCFVIMNRFPYNAGHLMIVPNTHSGDFTALEKSTTAELMDLLQLSQRVLLDLYKPQGFNIGANLGRVAGAGLPDHVHFHILPRWTGDTNFMPILAEIKVVSESLENSCTELRNKFRELC